MPRLVLVHDNIGGATGMGRVCAWITRTALDAGWAVSLVASRIEPELAAACVVVRAPAVHRAPAVPQHLGWLAAARLGLRRTPGDVVHVHAPGLIDVADVMTCHHLAAVAAQYGVAPTGTGLATELRRAQLRVQERLDDRWYRARRPATRMTFVSEFLRDAFQVRYGTAADGAILAPTAPGWRPVEAHERTAARAQYGVAGDRLVVGYLGGDDRRKGVDDVEPLAAVGDFELLVAGKGAERLAWPGAKSLGFVDADRFVAACDVVVAPALFDAAPVAVLQPLARGVPVVVREASGWAPAIRRHAAGVVWDGREPLAEAVRRASRIPPEGGRAVVAEVGDGPQRERLLRTYAAAMSARNAVARAS